MKKWKRKKKENCAGGVPSLFPMYFLAKLFLAFFRSTHMFFFYDFHLYKACFVVHTTDHDFHFFYSFFLSTVFSFLILKQNKSIEQNIIQHVKNMIIYLWIFFTFFFDGKQTIRIFITPSIVAHIFRYSIFFYFLPLF